MAIKYLTVTCDGPYCNNESDEYEDIDEALEMGWFILRGPERILGGDGEKCYCSTDCLEQDL